MPAGLAVLLVQTLLTYGPGVVISIIDLIKVKGDPTPEQWDALLVTLKKTAADYKGGGPNPYVPPAAPLG
jgi:hypothetical protein